MKESVNKAFVLLDEVVKLRDKRSKELNNGETFFCSYYDFDPEERNHVVSNVNPLLWETTTKDHNGYLQVFFFKTTNKYRNTSHEYKDVVMKESELRKVLIKNDHAEVGITIEDSLCYPTENIWGYTFGHYKYYIIMDSNLTITNLRSDIRKIYNKKEETYTPELIRVQTDVSSYVKEIENCYKLSKNVFTCDIDDETYLIGSDESLFNYACEMITSDDYEETLISILGGKEEIIKMFLGGTTFNPYSYWSWNQYDLISILGIKKDDYELNVHEIEYNTLSFNDDDFKNMNGLHLYKIE